MLIAQRMNAALFFFVIFIIAYGKELIKGKLVPQT